jgi:hypothetical protein
MTTDKYELEKFLSDLKSDVVAIISKVTLGLFWAHRVDFLLIIEKLSN